jgi:diamine N-acetyltransferase
MNGDQTEIDLVDVDASNWRDVAAVKPRPEQELFVAPTTYYLCLAHYDAVWNPLAITRDGSVVGHLMWAVDEEDDSTWLGGVIIDSEVQHQGVGRAAVLSFIDRFSSGSRANLALSYAPDNRVARHLYADLGFIETGEMAEDEIVARLRTVR